MSTKCNDKNITALYIRVSTEFQSEEGYSLEAQQEKLKKWCEIKDYNNYEIYQDGGWSGSNLDRPAMKKLISDILSKKIKRVVVYKLDRLSRSQKDTLFLLEEIFIPNDIEFFSMNENFDTSTPYGKAMIGILSVFAQLERENIRERTRMGMYERVKEGYWMGGNSVPFGYDYDANKDTLIPNSNAEDVKQIYDLYLQGYSTTKLSQMFPVSSDRHITNILDRITYLGKISYKGEVFQGIHEPIIDEVTWKKVQAERQKRSTKNVVTSNYLLTGLLYCGKCGARMRYQKWGKDGLKVYCYSQQTSKESLIKNPNCDNLKYDAFELDKIVLENLFKITDNITAKNTNIYNVANARSLGLNVLQSKYDTLFGKIKRLYNLYAENENGILLQTIRENEEELNSICKVLNNEKASIEAIKDVATINDVVKNLRNKWNGLTIQEKHKVLRICIDKIIITDGAIDIHYLV